MRGTDTPAFRVHSSSKYKTPKILPARCCSRAARWSDQVVSFGFLAKRSPFIIAVTLLNLLQFFLPFMGASFAANRYWDPNGVVPGGGGSGSWNQTDIFWSDSGDGVSGSYSIWDNTSLDRSIFAGIAGTVTVGSPVTIGGAAFNVDGYVITGGELTLGQSASTILVGDGTVGGAAVVATINSVLSGNAQLVKTDAGILVLKGTNSYSGGTLIEGGTVRISSDSNLGDVAGGLAFQGGTLNTTANLSSTRTLSLVGDGTITVDTGTTFNVSGPIEGAGSLTKRGGGGLVLTGEATHGGGTTIAAGTLQLGNGGVAGSIAGNIINNGALLFNRSDALTYAGVISGTGAVTHAGSGVLSMSGLNAYSGATVVDKGKLLLTDGGKIAGTSVLTLRNGGVLQVDSAGSSLVSTGAALNQIGAAGSGTLTVDNAGSVTLVNLDMASANGSSGFLNVTGGGSQVINSGQAIMGRFGNATVNVRDGGKLVSSGASPLVGGQFTSGNGFVTVAGQNSQWIVSQQLLLRRGSVTVSDGGRITAQAATIGFIGVGLNAPSASLLVTGTGSKFETTGTFQITNAADSGNSGTVTIANGGTIKTGNGVLAMGPGNALLNIGSAEGSTSVGSGLLDTASVTMAVSGNRINFNHNDANYTFSAKVSGAGSIIHNGSGATVLTGANSYKGTTTIKAGSLYVNGDQSQANGLTTVQLGAKIGGRGTIGGDVDVFGGVSPGDPNGDAGVLTINGNLLLHSGSFLSLALGQAGTPGTALNDRIVVNGNLTLDGTLDVYEAAGGNYGPGIYRIIDYTGILTDNGLSIGNLPNGSGLIQTSVQGQINLIAGGTDFSYWDGDAGPKFNGVVDGGEGTWQRAGSLNWTESSGNINTTYNDGTFAIFAGVGGTVSVDDSDGMVTAAGLQFASDGYRIAGDRLTLTGPQSTIRVGDGTSAGENMTASIDVELAGDTQLVKTDLGALALLRDNSYTGGTILAGGTLIVSSDKNLGASGGLTFEGGTLRTTADIDSERPLVLSSAGTVLTDDDTKLTFNGEISGTGALTKEGGGKLEINGDNSYSGGTVLRDGTVSVSSDKNLGAPNSHLIFSGGTLQTTADFSTDRLAVLSSDGTIFTDDGTQLAFNGEFSGTGALTKEGGGKLELNGDNSYGGGTVLRDGTVSVSSDMNLGAATGDLIFSGGILQTKTDFSTDRSAVLSTDGTVVTEDGTTLTFNGEITGVGGFRKEGGGRLKLNGDNTYAGGTVLSGGTLSISSDKNLGAATGDLIFSGGILNTTADMSTDRSVVISEIGTIHADGNTTLTLNGTLSGAAALTKAGAGRLKLTGDNSAYLGDTNVVGGILAIADGLASTLTIGAAGRLEGTGAVGTTTNAGTISPGIDGFGTLTVIGDYVSNDGQLEISSKLGDDMSTSSHLVVVGGTAGNTTVVVTNRGGHGGLTVDGIKIVDIKGASNGKFSLAGDYVLNGEQAVVAGAYGYRLYKGSLSNATDGSWYLRSISLSPAGPTGPTDPETPAQPVGPQTPLYQPGVALFETYTSTLQQLNKLGTLKQRAGNRIWAQNLSYIQQTHGRRISESNGIWGRIEAAHGKFGSATSTSHALYDVDGVKFQAGVEGLLLENTRGLLIGGIYMQYLTGSSDVASTFGDGSIESAGYGIGGTLTWYGSNGLYFDAVGQASLYRSDLDSVTLRRRLVEGNRAAGYSLSIETGWKYETGNSWSLTPQGQLIYSAVHSDDFTDPFGAVVSFQPDRGLGGRLGVALERDLAWRDQRGQERTVQIYGIGNLYYGFVAASKATVSGVEFTRETDRWWGGLGVGGSYTWGNDKYSVSGEARYEGSLSSFADNYVAGGSVRFQVKW